MLKLEELKFSLKLIPKILMLPKFIDDFLNGITMYRLVLYFLIFLLLAAMVFSFFKFLPFDPFALFFSAAFLTLTCWLANKAFAKIFKAPTNLESVYITALILTLIITPMRSYQDVIFLSLVVVSGMGSKYILAIQRQHLFNPAAFAVVFGAIILNYPASWWIGTFWMMPLVVFGGLLVVRKIRRSNMVLGFFATSLVIILGFNALNGSDIFPVVQEVFFESPILFFAFVMLTEPQTTPPGRIFQIIYGSLVGLLFASPLLSLFSFLTPEIALMVGNIFSYRVSPKGKLLLKLKQRLQIAPDIYDFAFEMDKKFTFLPGQYLEWTLSHPDPDSRGVRRYFTIASSPTEGNLRIGIKFYPNSSSFKKALVSMEKGSEIVAGQLAGEFTLPKDPERKLVFIAGGVGITPMRSMIKYLLDTNQKRDISILYSNKAARDIVYKEIFDKALKKLGIKTVYTLTDTSNIPSGWKGRAGYIDANFIAQEIPDYQDRIFYISGPHSMIDAFVGVLKGMGIPGNQIKVDFFPGYA